MISFITVFNGTIEYPQSYTSHVTDTFTVRQHSKIGSNSNIYDYLKNFNNIFFIYLATIPISETSFSMTYDFSGSGKNKSW